jgi:mRNA-degrading endonuclease RelE of RelBE toxin-antitoxin system
MHQIVLSESASSELSQLNKLDQLDVVAEFSRLRAEALMPGKGGIGEVKKGSRSLLRCRYKEYRIYFEKKGDQLVIHHVLHGNTLRDFLVRSNLDLKSDDELEKSAKFWKFIEQQEIKVRPPSKSGGG